jgi:hypothetical protein
MRHSNKNYSLVLTSKVVENLTYAVESIGCIVLLLALVTLSSAAQTVVSAPFIQNPSIVHGANTRTMWMQIPTQAGVNYAAELRSQLGTGFWLPFTNFVGTGSSYPFSNNVISISRRFFRVVADPRPWIRGEPLSRDPYDGETVQLDVVATGMAPMDYQWYGPNGMLEDGGKVSGSTTPNLVISNVDPGDEGNYWVSVTNQYGSTSSIPAGIRITLSQAPRVLIDPQSQTLLVGQSLSLWSTASGAQPLSYKWHGPAGTITDGGRIGGTTTTNLTVADMQILDDGDYYMVVSNAFGLATSAIATVRIQLGQSPRISTYPASQAVVAGDTVNLNVVATGTGTLTYEWHGPSGILSNGGKVSGAASANLAISNFQATEDGDYFVVVSNPFGNATSSAANVRVQ